MDKEITINGGNITVDTNYNVFYNDNVYNSVKNFDIDNSNNMNISAEPIEDSVSYSNMNSFVYDDSNDIELRVTNFSVDDYIAADTNNEHKYNIIDSEKINNINL